MAGQCNIQEMLGKARNAGYEVYAPARAAEGWAWRPWEGEPCDCTGYLLTTLSVKSFFLPQTDNLFEYTRDGATTAEKGTPRRAVFGVRPCDARAVALMDKIYAGGRGYVDNFYRSRRENTVLVVRACENPAPTCFCVAVGSGPADPTGADVILYTKNNVIVGEAASPRGEEFLKELNYAPADAKDLVDAKNSHAEIAAAMTKPWDVNAVRPLLYKRFRSGVWEDIATRCISCLACTFVCPSCHCFDVVDEGKHGRGVRRRLWDGCTVKTFTLHASGHNPRTTKAARYRQRVLHKFYYFYENWGETLCVGCGRCVVYCPVNIDIREAVARASQE